MKYSGNKKTHISARFHDEGNGGYISSIKCLYYFFEITGCFIKEI